MSASSQQHWFVSEWVDGPPAPATAASVYQRRALLIWPGLDRARLRRTHGDPWKIARLVGRRSSLPTESILTLLMGIGVAADASTADWTESAAQQRPEADG